METKYPYKTILIISLSIFFISTILFFTLFSTLSTTTNLNPNRSQATISENATLFEKLLDLYNKRFETANSPSKYQALFNTLLLNRKTRLLLENKNNHGTLLQLYGANIKIYTHFDRTDMSFFSSLNLLIYDYIDLIGYNDLLEEVFVGVDCKDLLGGMEHIFFFVMEGEVVVVPDGVGTVPGLIFIWVGGGGIKRFEKMLIGGRVFEPYKLLIVDRRMDYRLVGVEDGFDRDVVRMVIVRLIES